MKSEVMDALHVTSGRDHKIAPKLGFALPESKFQRPAVRPGLVVRTALVEQLAASRAPVITVAAPPGYGKTTLMAQWAERIGSRVAWLSCDEEDNDPVVLLSALAVALDRIGPVDPAIFSALALSRARRGQSS
jgi:LuxR family maltose regulon positive regulatory protein